MWFCSSTARRSHGYPPDNLEKATQTVLEQAAVLSEGSALRGARIVPDGQVARRFGKSAGE
jgi:hypothetical protein